MVALVAFVWLFSTVCFQMSPQIACPRRGIVTLVAFVWPFSAVRFQMTLQITCLKGNKVALVEFAWLFSTVSFHMCPQSVCINERIVTLVAFVWLSSTVYLHVTVRSDSIGWSIEERVFTFIAFVRHFLLCVHFWRDLVQLSQKLGSYGIGCTDESETFNSKCSQNFCFRYHHHHHHNHLDL